MKQVFFFMGLFLPALILGLALVYVLGGIGMLVTVVLAMVYGWNYHRIYAAVTRKK